MALPGKQSAWLITRYEDVAATLKDERVAKDRSNALTPDEAAKRPRVPGFFKPLTRNMPDLYRPDHTRLRALVHKEFTPKAVEQLRGRIEAFADDSLPVRRD